VAVLAGIGGGAFVLVSFVVGVRLLWLARRSQQLPEFTMGLCLLLMGGIGYPLATAARMAVGLQAEQRGMILAAAILCNTTGYIALAVFNWRVFRRESVWGEAFVITALIALVITFLHQSVTPGFVAAALAPESSLDPDSLARAAVGWACLAWATAEAGLYYSQMRRRVRVGLADPIVADRMRLWTFAIGSATSIAVVAGVGPLFGFDVAMSPLGGAFVGPLGLLAAGAAWLAFVPPRAYVRRVARRAASPA
jgi:hypothetical protein